MEKIQGQLPGLCEKYALKSLQEPIAVDWTDDSLKAAEGLMQFLALDDYRGKAMQVLQQQSNGIMASRQADFDRLLLNEFKTTADTIAVQMRSALELPTDDMLLIEARKWYGQRQ